MQASSEAGSIEEPSGRLKVVLAGAMGCGKLSLRGGYQSSSADRFKGVAIAPRINGHEVAAVVETVDDRLDAASRGRVWQDAGVVILLYSAIDHASFDAAFRLWAAESGRMAPDAPKLLVATKMDRVPPQMRAAVHARGEAAAANLADVGVSGFAAVSSAGQTDDAATPKHIFEYSINLTLGSSDGPPPSSGATPLLPLHKKTISRARGITGGAGTAPTVSVGNKSIQYTPGKKPDKKRKGIPAGRTSGFGSDNNMLSIVGTGGIFGGAGGSSTGHALNDTFDKLPYDRVHLCRAEVVAAAMGCLAGWQTDRAFRRPAAELAGIHKVDIASIGNAAAATLPVLLQFHHFLPVCVASLQSNNLRFWLDATLFSHRQDLHCLRYANSVDFSAVSKKERRAAQKKLKSESRRLYREYIVAGSEKETFLSTATRSQVTRQLAESPHLDVFVGAAGEARRVVAALYNGHYVDKPVHQQVTQAVDEALNIVAQPLATIDSTTGDLMRTLERAVDAATLMELLLTKTGDKRPAVPELCKEKDYARGTYVMSRALIHFLGLKEAMGKEMSDENLLFWLDVEDFCRTACGRRGGKAGLGVGGGGGGRSWLLTRARHLLERYVSTEAEMMVNLPGTITRQVTKAIDDLAIAMGERGGGGEGGGAGGEGGGGQPDGVGGVGREQQELAAGAAALLSPTSTAGGGSSHDKALETRPSVDKVVSALDAAQREIFGLVRRDSFDRYRRSKTYEAVEDWLQRCASRRALELFVDEGRVQACKRVQQRFGLMEDELLARSFPCALEKRMMLHGTLHLTKRYLAFTSSVFGLRTQLLYALGDLCEVARLEDVRVGIAGGGGVEAGGGISGGGVLVRTVDGKEHVFKHVSPGRDELIYSLQVARNSNRKGGRRGGGESSKKGRSGSARRVGKFVRKRGKDYASSNVVGSGATPKSARGGDDDDGDDYDDDDGGSDAGSSIGIDGRAIDNGTPAMSDDDWATFKDAAETVEFAPGSQILREGDCSPYIYQIGRGRVRIEATKHTSGGMRTVAEDNTGDEGDDLGDGGPTLVVLRECGVGEIIGEVSFLQEKDRAPSTASVVAVDNVVAYRVSNEAIDRIIVSHPALAGRFFKSLAHILKERLNTKQTGLANHSGRDTSRPRGTSGALTSAMFQARFGLADSSQSVVAHWHAELKGKVISMRGDLFLGDGVLCFSAKVLGTTTKVVVALVEIVSSAAENGSPILTIVVTGSKGGGPASSSSVVHEFKIVGQEATAIDVKRAIDAQISEGDASVLAKAATVTIGGRGAGEDINWDAFLAGANTCVYSSGQSVVSEGEVSDFLFQLGGGACQVQKVDAGGRVEVLRVMQRGELFGEMSFLERGKASASIVATEDDTIVYTIDKDFVDSLLELDSELASRFYKFLAKTLAQRLAS